MERALCKANGYTCLRSQWWLQIEKGKGSLQETNGYMQQKEEDKAANGFGKMNSNSNLTLVYYC